MFRLLATVVLNLSLPVLPTAPFPREVEKPILYGPTTPGAKYVYKTTSRINNILAGTSKSHRIVRTVTEKKDSKAKLLSVEWMVGGKVADTTEIEVSDQGLVYSGHDGKKLNTPFQLLKLPSKTHDTWKTALPWEDDIELEFECTNEGIQTVEVPAGKFRTIRVKAEYVAERKEMHATTWYSPGVGPVKCLYTLGEESTEIILMSFKPGKE